VIIHENKLAADRELLIGLKNPAMALGRHERTSNVLVSGMCDSCFAK
jgi:hypothetical protein